MATETIAEKLGADTTVWVSGPEHGALIEPIPEGARRVGELGEAAVAVLVAADVGSARKLLDQHRADLAKPATLWVAYPTGNKSDINRDTLRLLAGEYGLRSAGQVVVGDVWSALRFCLKDGEDSFTGGC